MTPLLPGARVTVEAKSSLWSPLPMRVGGVVVEVLERLVVVQCDDDCVRSVRVEEVACG